MIKFTHKNVIKFINLISEQPDLYDQTSPHFKSKSRRAKIWQEIASKFDRKSITGDTCRVLWNKLKKSYQHFLKTGSVVTKRSYAKSKLFDLMTFLDVNRVQGNESQQQENENQQGPENQRQENENQQGSENEQLGPENEQQGPENQQQENENLQGAENQQQGPENQQQGPEYQQLGPENEQQGPENEQQGPENQQQENENLQGAENQQQGTENQQGTAQVLAPKNNNVVKKQQGKKQKLGPKTRINPIKVKGKRQGVKNKSIDKSATSVSGDAQQHVMHRVELNISNFDVNVGSECNEKTPQMSTPKARNWPQQPDDENIVKELDLFSSQVRTTLGRLPCELQIRAQEEMYLVLTKYKKMAACEYQRMF